VVYDIAESKRGRILCKFSWPKGQRRQRRHLELFEVSLFVAEEGTTGEHSPIPARARSVGQARGQCGGVAVQGVCGAAA
jgi:hypothetical protein